MQRFWRVYFSFIKKVYTGIFYIDPFGRKGTGFSFLNTLTTNLSQYESKQLREKIYLQTDKSFYIAGEICWFKSYVVDASAA